MHKLLLLSCTLVHATLAHAQDPDIEWQRCLGGSRSSNAHSALITADGGSLIIGETNDMDGDVSGWHPGTAQGGVPALDIWVVKLSATGALEWQRPLGGSGMEYGHGAVQSTDGAYIVFGSTTSDNDGDVTGYVGTGQFPDLWVVKLSAGGELIWQRTLGGSGADGLCVEGYHGQPWSAPVVATADGGCIITGYASSDDGEVPVALGGEDAWLIKLDGAGEVEWQHIWGGSSSEYAYGLVQVADGGTVVGFNTNSIDGDAGGEDDYLDAWLLKHDASGTLQWSLAYGGSDSETVEDMLATSDGGVVFAGMGYSPELPGHHGDADIIVVKVTAAGAVQWERALGGSLIDQRPRLALTTDGGYFIAGITTSADGDVNGFHGTGPAVNPDIWVVRLNAAGELLWQHCLGGTLLEVVRDVIPTADGGCLVHGFAESTDGDVTGNHGEVDNWTVKLSASGALEWQKCLGTEAWDATGRLLLVPGHELLLVATASGPSGDVDPTLYQGQSDTWVVKLGRFDDTGLHEVDPAAAWSVYPVPSSGSLHFRFNPELLPAQLVLLDALGRAVQHTSVSSTAQALDLQRLARGTYLAALRTPEGTTYRRFLLE